MKESTLIERDMRPEEIEEFSKVSAALLVGMAAGLTNLEYAKGWDDEAKSQFAEAVESAKRMLWGDETTTQVERCVVCGLVDDMMLGLVTGNDALKSLDKARCYSVSEKDPPRDGTRVLLFIEGHGWVAACWETTAHDTDDRYATWCVDDFKHGPYAIRGYTDDEIRYWMPMPEVPF